MSGEQRKTLMSRFKATDTKPELLVRKALHAAGRRFRLHRKDLPGRPDIALSKDRTVVMVHGCFWHSHFGCKVARVPSSNSEFWLDKFARNRERDERVQNALEALGWRVVVVWECEARSPGLTKVLEANGLI